MLLRNLKDLWKDLISGPWIQVLHYGGDLYALGLRSRGEKLGRVIILPRAELLQERLVCSPRLRHMIIRSSVAHPDYCLMLPEDAVRRYAPMFRHMLFHAEEKILR